MENPAVAIPTPYNSQLVLIRANSVLFYAVALAAVLEADSADCAERLQHLFHDDIDFCGWLGTEWRAAKVKRAAALRHYLESTWPEFDFEAALDEYRAGARRDCGTRSQPAGAAQEMLARCLAAAQGALFYRCLAVWAEDRRLRDLAADCARAEASALPRFRHLFEANGAARRLHLATAWRAARSFVRSARDVRVPAAYACLEAHWQRSVLMPLSYSEFIVRMRAVIERHGDLGLPERVLFRPWLKPPRVRIAAAVPAASRGFRSVVQTAA